MKTTKIIYTTGLLLSSFLFSCRKTTPVSTPVTTTYSSMDEVFGQLNLQSKTLTVDAAIGGSFFGNSGTHYNFYPNAFKTASGANVTGSVQIEVTEYLQKGDMLFSKMLPISNNEPLLSGGEINVVATQGGQEVFLKWGYPLIASVPVSGTAPTGMKLFTGQPNLDTTQMKANWVLPVRDSAKYMIGIFVQHVGSGGGDTLNIVSDSLRLCNADQFMTSPIYQTFTVTIAVTGATLPSTGVFGYTLYDTYKGVWPLGRIGSYSAGVFTEMHVPNIPVHFVVFTLINGKFYGGTLGATPATGSNYTVTLTQQDAVAFKTQLNNL